MFFSLSCGLSSCFQELTGFSQALLSLILHTLIPYQTAWRCNLHVQSLHFINKFYEFFIIMTPGGQLSKQFSLKWINIENSQAITSTPRVSTISVRIDVITLFPDFFSSPLQSGLLGKALAKQIATVNLLNPRDFALDKHRRVDDEPYGGGVGMLLKPEPIFAAVESLVTLPEREIILMTPQGQPLNQALLQELASQCQQLVLICGHYEGVDERVRYLATREVSLGDFVLTCGEIPALTLINGVVRLLPGTVGKEESLKAESFAAGLLDYPQYTRPAVFRGWEVPQVLRSGDHQAIAQWRKQEQIKRTQARRPDLWDKWLNAGNAPSTQRSLE
jgi:tRNA (guanine37-N1)-methyltransferase